MSHGKPSLSAVLKPRIAHEVKPRIATDKVDNGDGVSEPSGEGKHEGRDDDWGGSAVTSGSSASDNQNFRPVDTRPGMSLTQSHPRTSILQTPKKPVIFSPQFIRREMVRSEFTSAFLNYILWANQVSDSPRVVRRGLDYAPRYKFLEDINDYHSRG